VRVQLFFRYAPSDLPDGMTGDDLDQVLGEPWRRLLQSWWAAQVLGLRRSARHSTVTPERAAFAALMAAGVAIEGGGIDGGRILDMNTHAPAANPAATLSVTSRDAWGKPGPEIFMAEVDLR